QITNGEQMSYEDEIIVSNDLGEVLSCDCGGINLVMGPMTLHFAPDELSMLYELVNTSYKKVNPTGGTGTDPKLGGHGGRSGGSLH
ncbi:hypothetical protein KAI87_01655, partial [Myxococcota bacterium]|nr:hypothetical protein [Myxococcota bacterium]